MIGNLLMVLVMVGLVALTHDAEVSRSARRPW